MSRQKEILDWAQGTFGVANCEPTERAIRFFEEAAELCHSLGLRQDVMMLLVARAFSGDRGMMFRELGQTQMTLEALAEAMSFNLDTAAQIEFNRVKSIPRETWQKRYAKKPV